MQRGKRNAVDGRQTFFVCWEEEEEEEEEGCFLCLPRPIHSTYMEGKALSRWYAGMNENDVYSRYEKANA